jgi:pyruvate/2-oxoglutarate dehydrogenase complex dihydrolipoamide acyltransferase (E2) component
MGIIMGRKDAHRLKGLDSFHRFYSFLMPRRTQSVCWTVVQTNASNAIAFIDEKSKDGHDITIFQLVVSALIRTASQFPEMNRFIYGHKFYARKEYTISFAISLGTKTIMRKIRLEPEYDIFTVSKKLSEMVSAARDCPNDSLDNSVDFMMKLPTFIASIIFKLYPWLVDIGIMPQKVVEDDVLYSSALVSNLGSFGLNAPFHHLYEWGSTSVFVTIGVLKKAPIISEDGTLKAADVIDFGFTVDERICDGKKLSDALLFFKNCIENPWILEASPSEVIRE